MLLHVCGVLESIEEKGGLEEGRREGGPVQAAVLGFRYGESPTREDRKQ